MADVWKETLLCGTQLDARHTGFTVRGPHIIQAHKNLQRMLKELKMPVAVTLEHHELFPDDPVERRAQLARGVAGHVKDSRISPRGTLECLLHIDPSEEVTARKCRFVSPTIFLDGYYDSYGRQFAGACVTSVAITSNPVQYQQRPLELSSTAGTVRLRESATPVRPPPSSTPRSSSVNDKLSKLAAALRSAGLNIPASAEASLDLLIVSVESNGSGDGGLDLDGDDDAADLDLGDEEAGADNTMPAGAAPTMLSRIRSDARTAGTPIPKLTRMLLRAIPTHK